jgi:plastocyanin
MTSRCIARRFLLVTGTVSAFGLAACGGREGGAPEKGEAQRAGEQGGTHEKKGGDGEGGKVITVQATTDEKGNYFSPSEIEAHQGDTLRITLVTGVHNIHFLADSNPGKTGLPPASDMLQLPGQTLDIPVTFAEGTYFFQCDPHAALGMTGHLKVED